MPSKFKSLFRPKRSESQSSLAAAFPPAPETSSRDPSPVVISPVSIVTRVQNSPAPIGEGPNYGVKVLHDGGTEASVDIIFVHGLTGNAYNTWLHRGTGVHWPSQLLRQDLPDTRILSFGYDADIVSLWGPASMSRLSNHSENMVGDLVRKREETNTETRKIIFVAHSLGGLVTEHALNHSRNVGEEHLHQIERCTVGIVFLGVPHSGTDSAAWALFGTRMASVLKRANKDIVKVLEPDNEMLRVVQKGFHNILRQRKDEGSEISVTCFYEELGVDMIGQIVPLRSAEISGYGCYGIHANHMDMARFSNREDHGYEAILGELRRWKRSACRTPGNVPRPASTTSNHHWMVPRSSSRLYTGRRELGERLAETFSHGPLSSPTQQRIFVIVGIGGTGKSEVCLKFAEDQRDKYWGIFWLDAASIATAEQGYVAIGRLCGLVEPSVETVKSWLAGLSLPWLLIIDNADNPEIDYSQYMPSGRRGDILLTTRNKECGVEHETVGWMTLDALELELARELLLSAASVTQSRSKEKEEAATRVVEILGLHTLAIVQAGAYIRTNRCTLEQYANIFRQQKEQLLKFHSMQNLSTYRNVYATFEVSAEYLQTSELPDRKDALDLLHNFAFMHNNGISEAIFQKASEHTMKLRNAGISSEEKLSSQSVRHFTRLPEYVQRLWSSSQAYLKWRNLCAILESLSIITTIQDGDSITISIHPLVHTWAKWRQDFQTQCRAWQSTATILALSCQGHYEYTPEFILLQPHVRACVSHEIEDYTKDISDMEAAQKLFQFASVLYRMDDGSSLCSLVERIRARLEDKDELDQEITLQLKIFVGRVSLQQGDYGKAVKAFREVFDSEAATLAENHPRRQASQYNLADAYRQNKQVDEAIRLFEQGIEIQKTCSAENDPSFLDAQHMLAVAYESNEQFDEAIALLEHVIKIQTKTLSEDHPSLLASQHNLANAYLKTEQVEKGIELFKHVVKIRNKTLMKINPLLLDSQHLLALAYQANGQIEEAMELLENVVQVEKRCFIEDHSSLLTTQHNLADVYRVNGQIEKAIELLEHVVKIRKKNLIGNHHSLLESQHNLAAAYLQNGQIENAIELLEHIVQVEKELADDDPSRLVSLRQLAYVYQANGRIEKAVELLEHVVQVQKNLAEDNPSRLQTQHGLALAYKADGQIEKAVLLFEYLVRIKKELTENDPSRIMSLRHLAYAYGENGQVDKKIQLLEHIIQVEKSLAEDDSTRLNSQHNLALTYETNGQLEKTIELLEYVVRVQKKLPEDDPVRRNSLHALVHIYRENGQVEKAEALLSA